MANMLDRYKIYLDVCCLNRPYDDQTQPRIRLESEAMLLILDLLDSGDWSWIGSDVMTFELDQDPDDERRLKILALLGSVEMTVALDDEQLARGQEIGLLGFHAMDALHNRLRRIGIG